MDGGKEWIDGGMDCGMDVLGEMVCQRSFVSSISLLFPFFCPDVCVCDCAAEFIVMMRRVLAIAVAVAVTERTKVC